MEHRDAFPEQYSHPLCGRTVRDPEGSTWIVERVVTSPRFGVLVPKPNSRVAFDISHVETIGE